MTLEAPTHTGTIHMHSNTWFVSGGVVCSNAFVRWISLLVLQLFFSTPRPRIRLSRFKRRHIVAVMRWKKFVLPLKPTIRSVAAAKDSFQRRWQPPLSTLADVEKCGINMEQKGKVVWDADSLCQEIPWTQRRENKQMLINDTTPEAIRTTNYPSRVLREDEHNVHKSAVHSPPCFSVLSRSLFL